MNWRFKMLLRGVLVVSILLQSAFSVDILEEDRPQDLYPVSRLGRDEYWAIMDEKKQNLMPTPRLGRKVWRIPSTLIPYPRAGRDLLESLTDSYDIIMPGLVISGLDEPWDNIQLEKLPMIEKRRELSGGPRIGRKKRSITEDHREHKRDSKLNSQEFGYHQPTIWEELENLDDDYYMRSNRQSKSRNAMVPRIGKKSSDGEFQYELKRKMLLNPRIGRASFHPRIGRSDSRFQVKSRGALIPRIGRRASAFAPRIGRSGSEQHESSSD